MRLDDAVTYFLGEWAAEGPSRDTLRSYTNHLKWLVGFAAQRHKVLLADLTPELLRAAMLEKQSGSHSPLYKGGEGSARGLASAARRMARWLVAQGVPVADLDRVKAPRMPERIQPRLRQGEFQALEGAILQRLVSSSQRVPRLAIARDLALIYMLADTGLRASEVCGMAIEDVDFSTGAILVIAGGRGGKGKKQRALSVLDPDDRQGGTTLRLLSEWIEARTAVRGAARNNRLWVSMKGTPLNRDELRRLLKRICEAAGLPSNRPPHAFRRASFTEGYLASPSSIRVLAARMGWSAKSHHMIDTYTRGVEIELARTTPVASVSARWRTQTQARSRGDGTNVRSFERLPRPMLEGVGSGGRKDDEPVPALPGTADRERTRLPNSRRSRHLGS